MNRSSVEDGCGRNAGPGRVIVFTRYPEPGRTKTRLIPALGTVGAARLHQRMAELLMARLSHLQPPVELEVRYTGGDETLMRRWLGRGVTIRPQPGGDLGQRMDMCIRAAFREGARRVILAGTDCPSATVTDIRHAMKMLTGREMVLGPTIDGGYWLIGLSRPARVFRDIPWSSTDTCRETLARAEQLGLRVACLPTTRDVDHPGDLAHLPAGLAGPNPWLSVVVCSLNDRPTIGRCLGASAGEGIEQIVADGGSEDNTPAIARDAGATVIAAPPGRARQLRAGFDVSHGHVVLLLHADTIVPAGFDEMIFRALLDRNVSAGAFAFHTDYDVPAMSLIDRLVSFRSRHLRLPYGDQGLFATRDRLREVGGVPDTPLAEDFFLVRRLARRGRIVTLPARAVTSGRRWRRLGVLRTTWINQLVAAGLWLGVDPSRLAGVYAWKSDG